MIFDFIFTCVCSLIGEPIYETCLTKVEKMIYKRVRKIEGVKDMDFYAFSYYYDRAVDQGLIGMRLSWLLSFDLSQTLFFLDLRVTNNELNFNFTNSLSVSDSDESTGGSVRVSDYIEGAKKGKCVLVTECRCIYLILWCQYLTNVIYYHFKTWVSNFFWEINILLSKDA